jgi:hypothetical protein
MKSLPDPFICAYLPLASENLKATVHNLLSLSFINGQRDHFFSPEVFFDDEVACKQVTLLITTTDKTSKEIITGMIIHQSTTSTY